MAYEQKLKKTASSQSSPRNRRSFESHKRPKSAGPKFVSQTPPAVVQQNGGAVQRSPKELELLQQHPTTETPSASRGGAGFQANGYTTGDRQVSSAEQRPNQTGLPDTLKSGIENLSGLSLDDVKVHYSSTKPAQLQAHAYTQGTEIHVASGHEKHLPHEAWHVVQQKQGRVKPTMQAKVVAINDDGGLEREADVMGVKALVKAAQFQGAPEKRARLQDTYKLDRSIQDKVGIVPTVQRTLSQIGTESGKIKSSGLFHKGNRTTINEKIEKYNKTAIPNDKENKEKMTDESQKHAAAQKGMQDLFEIQQLATRWLEGLKENKEKKIYDIQAWYENQFLPEYDRVESILVSTVKNPKGLSPLPKETLATLSANQVKITPARDKKVEEIIPNSKSRAGFDAKWEIVASQEYQITKPTEVYRAVNTEEKEPEKVTSYDPRSARSIRTKAKTPIASELMSYGHVYFTFNQDLAERYSNFLDENKPIRLATYTLEEGYKFKGDPEIPAGFRSISKLPKPHKVNPFPKKLKMGQ